MEYLGAGAGMKSDEATNSSLRFSVKLWFKKLLAEALAGPFDKFTDSKIIYKVMYTYILTMIRSGKQFTPWLYF